MMSVLHIRWNRKRARPAVLLALALCMALALTAGGCKDEPPVPQQVTKKVVPAPQKAPPPPEPKTDEAETEPAETAELEPPQEEEKFAAYRPKSERDPFKSFVTTRTTLPAPAARRTKVPKIKTPLQRYSLDQLKVVGIIAGGKMKKALLEDDVGKGYVVSTGDAVGSEGGTITSIQKDRIIIESTYRDVLGNEKVRHVTKRLYVSEEGENP
jgi:Tfp pilus assembly protein PilP